MSGLVLVALIVVYDAWHKTNPMSPVLMACTRMLVYVTAFVAFAPVVTFSLLFLDTGARSLYRRFDLYRQDRNLVFDRLLARRAALFACAMVGALVLPWSGFWLPLALALWVTYSVSFVYLTRDVGRAIGQLIAGVSLLDALVILLFGTFGGVWALAAFGLTLFLQRFIRGT